MSKGSKGTRRKGVSGNPSKANADFLRKSHEKFRSYLSVEDWSLVQPANAEGPYARCQCGCGGFYPTSWIQEMIPTVQRVLLDNNRHMLDAVRMAGYAPHGQPGHMMECITLMSPDDDLAIVVNDADSLLEGGRLWDKDKMDVFADYVIDVLSAAVVAVDDGRVEVPSYRPQASE